MSMAVLFVKIATILFCTVCLLNSLRKIYKGNHAIQYLSYLIVYFFFVLPVLIQIIFPYTYVGFYKANDALKDGVPYIIYCVFIAVLSYFMIYYKPKTAVIVKDKVVCNKLLTNVSFIVIVLTLLYTILLNGIDIIFAGYGARLSNEKYSVNEVIISCSLLCYIILLAQAKRNRKGYLVLSTFSILLLLWIHGKRFILAEFAILTIFVLFATGAFKGKTFIYLLFGTAFAVVGFSYIYGVFIKHNANSFFEYFSLDLSRP